MAVTRPLQLDGGVLTQAAQAAAEAGLTDSTGGTANDTLVDVATAAIADPAKINDNFADVSVKINKCLTVLRDLGLIAP